jgi:hypothetical protein
MSTETETESNVVPEMGVASTGAPRLDADPVDEGFMAEFDKLDDAASEAESAPIEPPVETPLEDENFLSEGTTPVETTTPPEDPSAPGDRSPEPEIAPLHVDANLDPEIAAIETPKNLSEHNQNNWKVLKETASRYKQEAAEAQMLRQRLSEMEQQPAQAPTDYEELKKFKQIFDLKNDPEFKTKYEAPINAATETIYSILKKNGATDETITSIQKAGGPDKVSEGWWKENVIDKLPMTDAERLKRNLVDVVDLKEKQDLEIVNTAQYAEQILEERNNEKIRWYQNETQSINQEIEELTKPAPWARFQQIPQGATSEQIAQIQRHNESVQELAQKFNQALWPQTASERTRVAAAAVLSYKLVDQLRLEQQMRTGLDSQLKKLQAENSQLKMAGRTPRASANSTQSKLSVSSNDRWKLAAGDAIDMGLDEAGA